MDPYLAQVLIFAGNFAPKGWAYCDGSLLKIASNTALFSLLGTMYGGDGKTTFALPNLMGRIPVGIGQGAGLPDYEIGQMGGTESVTLTSQQLPAHTHDVVAKIAVAPTNASTDEANQNVIASTSTNNFIAPSATNGTLGGVTASASIVGGNAPISILQPYLAVNFIICVSGIFPYRP